MGTPINTVIRFVPQQQAWVVERMGKYHRILEPGPVLLAPFLDKIRYVQSLKETALEIPTQSAITADNVTLMIDGILFIKVIDAFKASYGVNKVSYAISQLAQTTMRSEIGQLTLDHVLKERQVLNHNITTAVNEAALDWGVTCLRYEIRDIHPPDTVLASMHKQVSAERSKRADILESEGRRQSAVNHAEGKKASTILEAEANSERLRKVAEGQKASTILEAEAAAARMEAEAAGSKQSTILNAEGKATQIRLEALAYKDNTIAEAEAQKAQIILEAEATAHKLQLLSQAIASSPHGRDAVNLMVAEKYIDAFGEIAQKSNTMIVPGTMSDLSGLIGGSMTVLDKIRMQ